MDWLDLLAVQGTLKSLLQHYSSNAWILQHLAFFTVQLSHPYMTTGKTKALTRWTSVGKVMSLLFNMLSRLFIAFLPRSKCLLISQLQSPSAVIVEPRKIKSVTLSIVFTSIFHEVMGPDTMIFVFWMLSFKWTFSLSIISYTNKIKSFFLALTNSKQCLGSNWGFPDGSVVKNPSANAGDMGSIPGSVRSPEGGNGNLLQYSCLENPMDRRGWQATQSMGSKRVKHIHPQELTYCMVNMTSANKMLTAKKAHST